MTQQIFPPCRRYYKLRIVAYSWLSARPHLGVGAADADSGSTQHFTASLPCQVLTARCFLRGL